MPGLGERADKAAASIHGASEGEEAWRGGAESEREGAGRRVRACKSERVQPSTCCAHGASRPAHACGGVQEFGARGGSLESFVSPRIRRWG